MPTITPQSIHDVFGTLNPPNGAMQNVANAGIGGLLALGLRLVIMVAGLLVLLYLLWGALEWITSAGEKEKLSKAQNRMTHAVIGMFVVIFAFAIFQLVAGNILGIVERTDKGWVFTLPSINNLTSPQCSGACLPNSCPNGLHETTGTCTNSLKCCIPN